MEVKIKKKQMKLIKINLKIKRMFLHFQRIYRKILKALKMRTHKMFKFQKCNVHRIHAQFDKIVNNKNKFL